MLLNTSPLSASEICSKRGVSGSDEQPMMNGRESNSAGR